MANIVNVSVGGRYVTGVKTQTSTPIRVDTDSSVDTIHINPGSVVVTGKSPYINEETGNWMVYDDTTRQYVDTGTSAVDLIRSVSDEFIISGDGLLSVNAIEIDKVDGLREILDDKILAITAGGEQLPIVSGVVDIPMATLDDLGLVRSSNGENQVSVDNSGKMTVNSLNIDRLVQTPGERFTLSAGDSTD